MGDVGGSLLWFNYNEAQRKHELNHETNQPPTPFLHSHSTITMKGSGTKCEMNVMEQSEGKERSESTVHFTLLFSLPLHFQGVVTVVSCVLFPLFN